MDPSTLQQGTVVDRYTVEGLLGQGGMAMVLRVRHNQLGTQHALKVLTLVGSASIRERLVQEGRVQANLRHPNVVAVTDLVTLSDGHPGLIMEMVQGPSLEQLLHPQRLTLQQIDELARGILLGVAEAHRHGLVHRDLKPANILLEPADGTYVPKVADFGLAKILAGDAHSRGTRTGASMGTPQYMAPEQVRDSKNVGPAADIFALGAILYELITGQRAFDGEDLLAIYNAVAACRYAPIAELAPEAPPRWSRAIEAALQVDDEARPESVEALLALWTEGAAPIGSGPAFPGIAKVLSQPGTGPWSSDAHTVDQAASLPDPLAASVPSFSEGVRDSRISQRAVALAGGGLLLALLGVGMIAVAAVGAVAWLVMSQPGAPAEGAAGADGPEVAEAAEGTPPAEAQPAEATASAPQGDSTVEAIPADAEGDAPEGGPRRGWWQRTFGN